MIPQQLHTLAPILALQHGADTDEDLMAQQVVDLVEATPLCRGKCLVWAKSDRVVAAVKALAPRTPVGVVVMNETEQASAVRRRRALHYICGGGGGEGAGAPRAGGVYGD